MPGPLVIGIGNRLRGDDAFGPRVAEALVARGVPAVVHEADGLGLIHLWEGHEPVHLVDAARFGQQPGRLLRLDAGAGPLPAELTGGTSHRVGLAEAVELARSLERLPRRLVVHAVAGEAFGLGEPMTPAVEGMVEVLAQALAAEIGGG